MKKIALVLFVSVSYLSAQDGNGIPTTGDFLQGDWDRPAQVFDGAAGSKSVQAPLAVSAAGTSDLAAVKAEIPAAVVPAKPQDRTPGWKKFMLNGEESNVVSGAAGAGLFTGVITGIIVGWAINHWLGALLGFVAGGIAGAALGAALGYLFVKIFA